MSKKEMSTSEKKIKKKEQEPKLHIIKNNLYAIKTIWSISRRYVIHTAIETATGYFEWAFMSIYFLRYIINGIEKDNNIWSILSFVGICFAVFGALQFYHQYLNAVVYPATNNKIYKELYSDIYRKARNVELRCFEDTEFYNKYTMALQNADEQMIKAVGKSFNIAFAIFFAGFTFFSMFAIDPYSVLFVISPIIGNFVFGGLMNKIWGGRYVDNVKNSRRAEYVNRVLHLKDYAKEIRYSNIHDLMMKRFGDSIEGYKKVTDKYAKKAVLFNWLQNVTTFALVFEGIMIYAAYRTICSGTMGLAELAIMFSAMSTSSWILIGMFHDISDVMVQGKFLQYFRDFMEYKEALPEDWDGITPDQTIRSIEFKNVSFRYQEDKKPVVDHLSMIINENEICALVGHNGAGKSTLIKLLLRLYDPTEGTIYVNGIDIKEYNLKEYRKLFSVAFQDYKILAMSVRDNVLMGRHCEQEEIKVKHALELSGVWDKIESLPNGMDTMMTKEFDEDGVILSGGEQQKLVVARAFAQKAAVKIFDEPSSALDPIAEYDLYKNIMEESVGHISIFISHRLSSAKDANRIFMLENGKVLEEGTHMELMKQGGSYCEMYTKQAQNYLAVDGNGDQL